MDQERSTVETPVKGDVATELADLAGIWADLLAVEMALHYRSEMKLRADALKMRALWEAAVMAYGAASTQAVAESSPSS
jgi:hypothetical protein